MPVSLFYASLSETGILNDMNKLDSREDGADFVLSKIVHLLYAFGDRCAYYYSTAAYFVPENNALLSNPLSQCSPDLSEALKARVVEACKGFKYWIDEVCWGWGVGVE
jgi:hypothetical protein